MKASAAMISFFMSAAALLAGFPFLLLFSAVFSELGLDGLWLRLQGYPHCPLLVMIRVESSSLIFLESGWRVFAHQSNLRKGDSLCCRFDGEETLSVRSFDVDGNRLEP